MFSSDWDSLIIIGPYTKYPKLSKLDINNLSDLKSIIEETGYHDGLSSLLLVKGKNVTEYHTVTNNPINFSRMIPATSNYGVINRKVCDQIVP